MAKKIVATISGEPEFTQADFYETASSLSAKLRLTEANVDTLARRGTFKYGLYATTKRAFDVFASTIGCLVLLPVMVFVKIGNILTGDFKPMFLKQARLGRDGKTFNLIKFRSMVMLDDGRQADALLEELFEKNPELRAEYEENHKLDNDPRITKMGKFIRSLYDC